MTTTTAVTGTALAPIDEPLFSSDEHAALAGFLAGYSGLTRDAYTLDLRQYTSWCTLRGLHLFAARRVDIETFRGDMETAGRSRVTIARRLCTVAGFYRYAVEEDLLDHSPAAHVRRPRLDYESHATALDRNELGALLVAAGLGLAQLHALISLLALNGLRISEALGADITAMGSERGHRTSPCCVRAARSSRSRSHHTRREVLTRPSAKGSTGRPSSAPTGNAWTGTAPAGPCAASPNVPGIAKPISPHTLRQAFITAALDAGVPRRDVQEAASHADPRTTMRYDRGRASLDRHATYVVAAYLAGAAR
jgi:integrase/recombinase XerD